MRHVTVLLFSFASERLFSFHQQLEGEGQPRLSQSMAQDEEPRDRRLGGTEETPRSRKGSGRWKAAPAGGRHWALHPFNTLELRLPIQWYLEVEAIAGWPHLWPSLASTVWASAPRTVSLSCSLNQRDVSSFITARPLGPPHSPDCSFCAFSHRRARKLHSDRSWWVGHTSQRGERGQTSCQGKQAGQDPCVGSAR